MISTEELRDKVATLGSNYLTDKEWIEVIDRLEAAEKEIESWKGLARQFGNEADELRTHLSFAKDELNRLRAKSAEMVKLWKQTNGQAGWPAYNGEGTCR